MADWHGYPQRGWVDPERPWWNTGDVREWRRNDGLVISRDRFDPPLSHIISIGSDEPFEIAAARADAERPVPPPPPRCGQVWALPGKTAEMVVSEVPPHFPTAMMVSAVIAGVDGVEVPLDDTWPPPDAMLVAGPGAPWAPMGGDDA